MNDVIKVWHTLFKTNKPQPHLAIGLWFLFIFGVLAGCDKPSQPKSLPKATPAKMALKAPKNTNIMPDLSAKSVITTETIAIKNTAQYAKATHLPYANINAPKGGELSMSAMGTFNSLNAFIDKGVPATGTFYLYDTLMTGSLDEAYVLYPQLADKVTYDTANPHWVIYHIHPKARFWDGTKVTADDVKATFEAILTKGLMSWRGFLTGIDGIEALDEHRVLFYFNEQASQEMYANVGLMPVFAKKDIDKRFDELSLEPLMGSGAYQVSKAKPNRLVEYVKDPNYWGADIMANRGRFNFDKIKFVYYQDDTVALEAFKAGQFNFRIESDPKVWTAFEPKNIKHRQILKAKLTNTNPVAMQGLVMNIRRPLFADKRVRQALNLAFDWTWINRHLLFEQERLTSFFYGSVLMASGMPSPDERQILQSLPLNQDELSALAGVPQPVVSSGDGVNRQNLLKARQLLLDANFFYRDGRLFDKTGQLAKFDILVADDKHQAILLAYLTQLKRLGFLVRIRRMDNAGFLTKKRAFDYDMIIDRFIQGSSPGAEQAYLWGSQSARQFGNQNTIGIESQAVDSVIQKLTQAQSRQQVILYSRVLDRLLLAGEYMIAWGGMPATLVMYHDDITPPPRLPTAAIGLDYWYQK